MRTTKIRSKLSLLFIALATMIAIPAVAAIADTLTVSNTLVTNTDTSKAPGDTGTANAWLEVTKDIPTGDTNGCNVTASDPGTVTFSSNNPAVTFPNGNTVQLTDCKESDNKLNAKQIAYKVADDAQAGQAVISASVTGGKAGQTNRYLTTDTLTVTITAPAKQNTTTTSVSGTATYGGTADLTATLKSGTTNLANKTVTFTLNGTNVGTGTTDNAGVATKSGVALPTSMSNAGSYTNAVSANFAGDTGYNGSTGSGDLTVNKATGSVSIDNIPTSATYGDTFTPTYTKSGDGTASTTSNTPDVCSVSGGAVSFDAAGTCKLQASVTAGTNHLAATGSEQSFSIAKASQTITFGALSTKTFGDADFQVSATGGDSGNPVTFSADGNCASGGTNGSTISITGAGSCTVTASQAGNSNYLDASPVEQSFTINKANQTITFGALSNKIVGAPNFTVSASSSSGLAVGLAASPSGTCTISGDTVTITGAGTCTITASQAGNSNYNAATPVEQKFNVTYTFTGFSSPVDNNGVLNSAKAGQAIPLKWRLTDNSGNPVTNLSSTSAKVTVQSLSCPGQGTTVDQLEEYAAGSSGLQNLGNGYYQLNWKTPTTYANSCKTMHLDLGEGLTHTALFKFTK